MTKLLTFLLIVNIIILTFSGCNNNPADSEPVQNIDYDTLTAADDNEITPNPVDTPSPTAVITPIPTTEPKPFIFDEEHPDYREAMRQWVIKIGEIARSENPNFLLIPQNCSPLFTSNGESDDVRSYNFLNAIDGVGRESFSYGSGGYGMEREYESRRKIGRMLEIAVEEGLSVLSVDYCKSKKKIAFSNYVNKMYEFIGFQAKSIGLTDIPNEDPLYVNDSDINNLGDAKNYLIILNPGDYDNIKEYLSDLHSTNYDVLIIDAFFYSDKMITKNQIADLKIKANGGKRIVISYLSIGEAEDYRDYWTDDYYKNPPDWMLTENPRWKGNYPVKYWDENWQEIIADGENSYLKRIVDAGFDGVYMDIVDGYETFEDMEDR